MPVMIRDDRFKDHQKEVSLTKIAHMAEKELGFGRILALENQLTMDQLSIVASKLKERNIIRFSFMEALKERVEKLTLKEFLSLPPLTKRLVGGHKRKGFTIKLL